MLVILEGADGSGKTSLATRIRKDLGQYCLFLRSSGPPTIGQLASVLGWLANLPVRVPVVTDRLSILSEFVYGPILRGKCIHGLSVEQMATWIKQRPGLVVHCRPPYSTLEKSVRSELQLEGVTVNLRHLVKEYDNLMGQLEFFGVPVKRYDWTGPPQLTLDCIQNFLRDNLQ